MKLSISNIAWGEINDPEMHEFLKDIGIGAIEIAPTRILGDNPYDKLEQAKEFKQIMKNQYSLDISSMQSIWYGESGNIFNVVDAQELLDYTKKAIVFAEVIGCPNLVFGCPKNRNMPINCKIEDADAFFIEIANFAFKHHTVIALEPNPTIYNTNFINTTKEAFEYVKRLNVKGLKVNVDFGTIIFNKESILELVDNISFINHIHISEPNLGKIEKRQLHEELKQFLVKQNYDGYISIEMKMLQDIQEVKNVINYILGVFK